MGKSERMAAKSPERDFLLQLFAAKKIYDKLQASVTSSFASTNLLAREERIAYVMQVIRSASNTRRVGKIFGKPPQVLMSELESELARVRAAK
jgi:hypothetical protein